MEKTRIVYHDAEYQTVWHEAEGHYEQQVTKPAYSETVLVKAAWDEEVVTGYQCSCGARK